MKETLLHWVAQHGYTGLFSLLVLGIVGLPVPDEWLLTLSGFFVFKRTFQFVPTVTAAFLGSTCGITISYILGRTLGTFVLVKYGSILHITHENVERVHGWFRRIGRWTLTFGYFIPGVRHLTAYVAGATELEFPIFTLFAYLGGFIWTLSFISLGYYVGDKWESILSVFHGAGLLVLVLAGVLAAGYLFVRYRKRGDSTSTGD